MTLAQNEKNYRDFLPVLEHFGVDQKLPLGCLWRNGAKKEFITMDSTSLGNVIQFRLLVDDLRFSNVFRYAQLETSAQALFDQLESNFLQKQAHTTLSCQKNISFLPMLDASAQYAAFFPSPVLIMFHQVSKVTSTISMRESSL